MTNNHEIVRKIFKWGSTGKHHNEPLKIRTLDTISDSHLLHIIAWIEIHSELYSDETLHIMLEEQKYRTNNYIFVADYE